MKRPPTYAGYPAFGCADNGVCAALAISPMESNIGCGPTLQFSPITSTRSSSSAWTISVGVTPTSVCPSSVSVIWATMGSGHASRAPCTAARISSRSRNVSRMSRSTPASDRIAACRRKAARACSGVTGPSIGVSRFPTGPMAPATHTICPVSRRASRAMATPLRLISSSFSSSP